MLPLAKTVRCNGLWQLLVMGAVHTGSLLLFLCFVLERGQGASQNRASSPRLAQWLRTQRTLLDCGRVVHSVQVAEDLLCAGTCGWGSLSRRGGVSCCGRWWAGGACDERSDLEGPSQGRPGSLSRWSVVGNSPVFSFFPGRPRNAAQSGQLQRGGTGRTNQAPALPRATDDWARAESVALGLGVCAALPAAACRGRPTETRRHGVLHGRFGRQSPFRRERLPVTEPVHWHGSAVPQGALTQVVDRAPAASQ